MHAPEFSVIIPMFNAASTIERCLASLQQQTFLSFEVIVVDNGSTDNCSDIVKRYMTLDSRFHYIYLDEVQGPSGARNHGLVRAQGNYIAFVDSDDWVSADYLEKLYRGFSESMAEVVFIGYTRVTESGTTIETKTPTIQPAALLEQIVQLQMQDMFGYTWIKALRRNVAVKHRFREDINLLEDEIFTCEVMRDCSSVTCLQVPLYNYVCGSEKSLMGRTHTDYCQKNQIAFEAWETLLLRSPAEQELGAIAEKLLTACQYYGFERDINPKDYFTDLIECNFWKMCRQETPFLLALQHGDLAKLLHMRRIYRWKVKIARLVQG